jgi:hypothetical protein
MNVIYHVSMFVSHIVSKGYSATKTVFKVLNNLKLTRQTTYFSPFLTP